MTARQPPGPPPLPNFDSYRPIEERAGEPRPPSRGASQSQRRRPVPKKQMGWLSWVLIGVLGFLGLAVGAGAVFILSLPKDFVRDEIVAQVNAKTGRELTIAGPASFRLYPSIGFSLADVSLSAPAGMAGKPLVQMASLDVSVRLLPLLKREVAIERLVLKKPVFELYADKDGRKSWDLASLAGPWRGTAPPVRLAQAGGGTASDAQGGMPKDAVAGAQSAGKTAALEQLELGDVRIEDGTVRYADARSGARQEASQIDVRLGLKSISQPLSAAGSLVWKAEKIEIDGKLTSVKSILEERPAKLVLTIASKPVSGSYDGTFIVKDAIDAEGSVAAKSESLKFLAKWLGTELPAVAGFGPLDIKGQFRAAGKVVSFANASISLDGATATGQITVDTAPTRPYLKGNLKLSELNLNKYIGNESYSTASEPVTASEPAPTLSPEKSIDELLSEPASSPPGPKVKGYTQRAGWSEGQIDASALGLADADF